MFFYDLHANVIHFTIYTAFYAVCIYVVYCFSHPGMTFLCQWNIWFVMAWCRADDKPLIVPMITQFVDAYIRYSSLDTNV